MLSRRRSGGEDELVGRVYENSSPGKGYKIKITGTQSTPHKILPLLGPAFDSFFFLIIFRHTHEEKRK